VTKLLRVSVWILAVVALLAIGLLLYLRNTDLSVYEEQIEEYLSEVIGHDVDVDGLFELRFGNLTRLTAEQIRITNSDWQTVTQLLSAGHLSVTIKLWSLFSSPIIIEDFEVSDLNIRIERNAEARSNWDSSRAGVSPAPKKAFDPDLIAFREARVQDVHFTLIDPVRPRPLNVSLEHLTVDPDASNILDLDLRGKVNEFPLQAHGRIGPWQNLLDGQNLSFDLDMTLGRVGLAVDGSIADLATLDDVKVTLELQGPAIERVTDVFDWPMFAEGAFKVDGSIQKIDNDNQIRLSGNLGAIDILASGHIDRLINPQRAELHFDYSGPDTMHVAEMFGIEGAPDARFHVSGDVTQERRRFEFSETRAQIGDNAITINGWVDTAKSVPDGDLSVTASGPNLSVVGPFTKIVGIPAEAFEIDGRIQKSGASVRFDDLKIAVGENRISANGAIGGQGSDQTEITFSASGPDISILQAMTGLHGIPQKPFTISAHVRPDKAGLKLQDALGVFGDNRVEANGLIGLQGGLAGTDLRVKVSGSDLMNVSLLAGAPYLPAGPFKAAARIQIKDSSLLTVSDATADTKGFSASANGTVGLAANSGQFQLQVSATGPDLADLLQLEFLDRLAGEAFRLEGGIGHNTSAFELDAVHVSIGNMEASIDGSVASDRTAADIAFKVTAPDATVLSEFSGYNDLPGGAVSIGGRFRKTLTDYDLDQVEFHIGDNALTADGRLSNAPLKNDSELRFSAAGPNLHQLGRPFGVDALPAKPFTVSGEVAGVPTGFAIEKLDARVGDNTLAGRFTADLRDKPKLSGVLSSSLIDITERPKKAIGQTGEPGSEKGEFIFSDKPFNVDWLQSIDLDIDVTIDRLIVPKLDFRELKTSLELHDGALDIDHMSLHEGGGEMTGNVHFEPSTGGYELDGFLNADNVRMSYVDFAVEDRSTLPPITGQLKLRGTGNSLHEMAASSNGVVSFTQGAGRSRDLAFLRRLRSLFSEIIDPNDPLLKEVPFVSLECAFYQASISNGTATVEKLGMQTDRVTVVAAGTIDLKSEALNLSLHAEPREGLGISFVGVAHSFVKLGGTLRKPVMQLDPAGSATTAGAAIATGGLSLLAKGLWDRASSRKGICDLPQP
jgi:uncharacterized protein involved in outer membrane biogenesis